MSFIQKIFNKNEWIHVFLWPGLIQSWIPVLYLQRLLGIGEMVGTQTE